MYWKAKKGILLLPCSPTPPALILSGPVDERVVQPVLPVVQLANDVESVAGANAASASGARLSIASLAHAQPEQNAYSLQAKGMKAPEIYKRNKWMKMKAMRFARRLGDHVALMASHLIA